MTRNPKQNKRPEDKCLLAKAIHVKIHEALRTGKLKEDPVMGRGGLRGLFDPHCAEWGAGDIVAKLDALHVLYSAVRVTPKEIADAVVELMQESHGYPAAEARRAIRDAHETYLTWTVALRRYLPIEEGEAEDVPHIVPHIDGATIAEVRETGTIRGADVDAADDEIDGGS